MKKLYQSQIFLLAFLVMIMLFIAPNFAQSQTAMNKAYSDFKRADAELNVVYQKILKSYSRETIFSKNSGMLSGFGSNFVMQNWPQNTLTVEPMLRWHPCANRYT